MKYYVFKGKNKNFLLTKYGTSIIVDDQLMKKIEKEDLDEDLTLKLIQRGFIKYKNSKEIMNCYDVVKPTFFLLDLTECCNLNCSYCFRQLEGKNMNIEMAFKICDYIKKYCKSNNIKKICIQPWGGEPLLKFDLIKRIQDYFENSGITVKMIIETNATLIDKKIANELYDRDFGVGVSIDGDEKNHNLQRKFSNGEGSYYKVITGIEKLNNAGYEKKIGTICVITKNNYMNIKEIIKHFVFDLGLKNLKFNLVKTNDTDLSLSENEIEKFSIDMFDTIIEIIKSGTDVMVSDLRYRLENLLKRANNSMCISCGCMSGRKMISFNYKGDIFPCQMSDFYAEKIGNIEDENDLIELIKKSIDKSVLYKLDKNEKCKDCPWWYYCKGGCKANKVYQYKFSEDIDKHECMYNRVIYPKLINLILDSPEIVRKIVGGE